jgi:hypothetical protein
MTTETRPNFTRDADGRTWTRRPIGHKVGPDGPEPVTSVRTFLYREDAAAAADAIDGYQVHVQYVGAWMRWTVEARRKSWSSARYIYLLRSSLLGRAEWQR